RRIESGINTDLEMTQFLNETSFGATPRVAGALEYRAGGEPITLAVLQSYTANSGDAWSYTLDAISRFFEDVVSDATAAERLRKATPAEPPLASLERPMPDVAQETIGAYLADAALLGRRTAQMHAALASRGDVA